MVKQSYFSAIIKAGCCLGLGLSLFGCSASQSAESSQDEVISEEDLVLDEPLKVMCPSGAPALASLGLYEAGAEMDYVQGQDNLVAELAKSESEYDIIIAPVNLGVKAFEENETWYLENILTWGNLYIIGEEDWDVEEDSFVAFGQNAVPGLVFNNLFPDVQAQVTWLSSVAEASQDFLLQDANAALLAEPQASVTIEKAAGQDRAVSVVADLQEMWQEAHDTAKKGYPQAAVFVKDPEDVRVELAISEMITFSHQDQMDIETLINSIGPDKLGVPSAEVAIATWDLQNIDIEMASEVKEDIDKFLALFNIEVPDSIYS